MSATDPTDPRYPLHRSVEEQALEALRAHRQQAGHQPWPHPDNEHLHQLDRTQKRQQQAAQQIREGLRAYQARQRPPAWQPGRIGDHLPVVTRAAAPSPDTQPTPLHIRIDPELGRLAIGLNLAAVCRLWAVARHYFGQPGHTTRRALFETASKNGLIHSRRHFNRLLQQGQPLFWGLADERVYLRGYVKVAQRLTELATTQRPELVATNVPGVRDVHLRAGGDLGDFKAQVYAGWLAYREAPTIARRTLSMLFGVSADTLRNWETRLGEGLETVANYAQTAIDPRQDERVADYLPAHCYNYVTRQGQIRFRWRQPNTYKPTAIRQHSHKGQSRKARFAAAKTAWFQPVEIWAARQDKLPFDRSHREPRRYFASVKQLRRHLKRLARKGVAGSTPRTPRYVYRGEDRYGHGIWELSLDGEVATVALERLSIKAEYRWWRGHRAHLREAKVS